MARDIRRENTDLLIAQIEEGKAPWQRDEIPSLQVNAVTGNAYNGMNQVMLGSDNETSDPRWCTWDQAQKNEWQIKQGSQGRPVEFFVIEGAEAPQVKRLHYTVFKASQIEGIPEYKAPEQGQNPEKREKMLEAAADILSNSGAKIQHDQQDKAFYRAATDTIHLPSPEKFRSEESYYATALHEMTKWAGGKDRLNREYGHMREEREEFRAELVSYQLAMRLGLPLSHEHQQQRENYQEKLVGLLKEDKNELARAAHDADKTTGLLLGYSQNQEQTQKQTREITEEAATRTNANRQTSDRLNEAQREADALGSLERSHDRTHIAGHHIDPTSREAAMLDAADTLKTDIHAAQEELNTANTTSAKREEAPTVSQAAQTIAETKIQTGMASRIAGTQPKNDIDSPDNLEPDNLENLNRADVYNETRDKIVSTPEEEARERDKNQVISEAQKEQESEQAQFRDADSEGEKRRRPYVGVVIAQGAFVFAQKISKDVVILHDIAKVTEIPEKGARVSIQYENGIGTPSMKQEKTRTRDSERSLSL